MSLRSEKGFTLLEILFALGILIVGVYLISEGVNQMDASSRQARLLSSTERTINAIVDNIRTGLTNYQISYDPSPATREAMLNLAKLPMAWGPGVTMPVYKSPGPGLPPVNQCVTSGGQNAGCPVGRYGVYIAPLPGNPGLYSVTLRMTTPEWKEPYRDYTFLATVQ